MVKIFNFIKDAVAGRSIRNGAWASRLLLPLLFVGCLAAQTPATITLNASDLNPVFNNERRVVRVTTTPADLPFSLTYAGSETAPTNAGTYPVVATITDPAYTGSASANLVIRKANQSINIEFISDKILGDAPFQIVATTSSGLPISQWQSFNESVASVSSTGMVTIVGAGEVAFIAEQSGDQNYEPAPTEGAFLYVEEADVPAPPASRELVYNRIPHAVALNTLPTGAATHVTYRDVSIANPPSAPAVIFQNCPDILDFSYLNIGFNLSNIMSIGKYVSFAGNARNLHSCDAVLVSRARYETTSSEWLAANSDLVVPPKPDVSVPGDSGGFYHPVTISFYGNRGDRADYPLIKSKTVNAFIPWRPQKFADGSTYTNGGYAFRVSFDFTEGFILPTVAFIAISSNTSDTGYDPVGVPGPYDLLHIANLPNIPFPRIGSGFGNPDSFYLEDWVWNQGENEYAPMLRIRATTTTATLNPPIDAGTYEVKMSSTVFDDLNATSTWVVQKAPLQINATNLQQLFSNSPKTPLVSTIPSGIPTDVTFTGLSTAPTNVGRYAFNVVANDRNYTGSLGGFMSINHTFATWRDFVFTGSGLPPEQMLDIADPNGDGISNFMAYATNSNAVTVTYQPISTIAVDGNHLLFTYQSNPRASDLVYSVEITHDLSNPNSWTPVSPIETTVLSDDDQTRVISVRIPKPLNQSSCFLRLKVSPATP